MSGEGASGAGRHTGRRGGGGRTRGPWHPGSRVQWYLVGCKAGKAGKLGDGPLRTQLEQGRFLVAVRMTLGTRAGRTYLSHLSLLFLQGSQLMALRARFVGGRGSWSPVSGLVRERTEAEVAACWRCFFGRGAEDEQGSALLLSSGMDGLMPLRIEGRRRFA